VKVARSVTLDEVRIEEVADPVPADGEVVCDVLACGVCASDVTDWYVRAKLPAVLGHEPAGLVTAIGEGVQTVALGDRVAIHHHAPCGECRRCRRGHETLCERFRSTCLEPGGFAERVRVPQELVDELLVLPDELDAYSATLIEPLACVMRAQDRASLRAGDSLLVVGTGCNGLLHIAAAHARGVEVVWAREPRPERLALAETWGAEHHGNELVDVAMVCTPKPDAIAAASAAIAPGGTLCLYAPPAPGAPLPIDGTSLFMREVNVTASYSAGPGDMRAALQAIVDGRVNTEPLVTHRVGLEETAHALSLQRRGAALKAVVVPNADGTGPGR
jgi:L-iditol 2-dehydrogenase